MGGVHIIQRTTNSANSNIFKATSVLTLPSSATYRTNTTPGIHGAFPEFIHGFYRDSYGFDSGLMYKDGRFWIFYGPLGNTGVWKEQDVSSFVSLGKTITLQTIITAQGVSINCFINGGGSATMIAPIPQTAYNELKKGCKFVREMCIAINPERAGETQVIVPNGASFTEATFKNTDMTAVSSVTTPLTLSNSVGVRSLFDTGTPSYSYSGNSSSPTVNGYVNDIGFGSI